MVMVFDDIIIHVVMIHCAVYLSVPLEILAGGGEYQYTPSVVNVYAEIIIVDLVEVGLWYAEEVVQSVPVRMDGVG